MTTTNEILSKYRNLVAKSKNRESKYNSRSVGLNNEDLKTGSFANSTEIKNRPSVVNLLRKFDSKPKINPSDELNETTLSQRNEKTILSERPDFFNESDDSYKLNENKDNWDRQTIQKPQENSDSFHPLLRKSISQRIKNEENPQRKSVSELIKLNEERLRENKQRYSSCQVPPNKLKISYEELIKEKYRNTTSHHNPRSVMELKEVLKQLREEARKDIKDDELIHVKEMISYFEEQLKSIKPKTTIMRKERNTMNNFQFKAIMNMRVSVIKEEDEENSRQNSGFLDVRSRGSVKQSSDSVSIHYLSTNDALEKKMNSDTISRKGTNNDDIKCKTLIKERGKILIDKNKFTKKKESFKQVQSNKSVDKYKDIGKIGFEKEKEEEKKHTSNNTLSDISKLNNLSDNKVDSETSHFKVLGEKYITDNKLCSELAQTNLVNDIHITSNKALKDEPDRNKNFSINNVNNILVIANYEKNKSEGKNKSFTEKFKMKETSKSELLYHEEKNKSKRNYPSQKSLRERRNKLITNQLKNLKYYGEESQENIRKSTKESGIDYKKNIINSLDKICVSQYNLGNFPFDHKFLDILCINCYECVKYYEVDKHSETCVVKPFTDECYNARNIEEDINSKIYKLYQNLRKRESEIESSNNDEVKSIFNELSGIINTIFLNNNSLEELDISINKLNILINSRLVNITSDLKLSLLIYSKRVSQLVFSKLKEIEQIIRQNEEENIFSAEERDSEDDAECIYLKNELKNLERETMKSRMELIAWRKEAKCLEKMLQRPNNNPEALSDIVSEVVSHRAEEELDNLTSVTGQSEQDIENINDVNEIINMRKKTEEDLRKYFISMVLNYKFKFVDKLEGNINIDEMYDKVKRVNLPLNEWESFIQKELKIL